MRLTNFPVQIELFSQNIHCDTLLIEFRSDDRKSVFPLLSITLSAQEESKIDEALADDKETTLFFYPQHATIGKIQCYFPAKGKDITNERSEYLRALKGDIAYYPHFDEVAAFEIFTLARYHYDVYKTEKTRDTSIFYYSTEEILTQIVSKKLLLESVILTRDLVNMPSEDLYPESFVELIRERKWKNFDVAIFGEEDLKKLGCNLILAA